MVCRVNIYSLDCALIPQWRRYNVLCCSTKQVQHCTTEKPAGLFYTAKTSAKMNEKVLTDVNSSGLLWKCMMTSDENERVWHNAHGMLRKWLNQQGWEEKLVENMCDWSILFCFQGTKLSPPLNTTCDWFIYNLRVIINYLLWEKQGSLEYAVTWSECLYLVSKIQSQTVILSVGNRLYFSFPKRQMTARNFMSLCLS